MAFGVVYQLNSNWILDYEALANERNNLPDLPEKANVSGGNASAPKKPQESEGSRGFGVTEKPKQSISGTVKGASQ
jgi:hypothetical protein